ncbi:MULTISPECIES: hypothetical protein [unclassified Streptomyces]|uniref:hypothetical protein n=1 Tax=unclassified Streptomyces TaxID=2593676 RepID=UPI00381F9EEF
MQRETDLADQPEPVGTAATLPSIKTADAEAESSESQPSVGSDRPSLYRVHMDVASTTSGGRFLLTLTLKAYAGTNVQAVHPDQ